MKRFIFLLALTFATTLGSTVFAQNGIWLKYTRSNSQLSGDSVMSIAFDGNNSAWFYSEILGGTGALSQLTGTTWKAHNEINASMYSNIVNPLGYFNGAMWAGNFGQGSTDGLSKYDGSSWTTYTTSNSGLVDQPIVCLMPDNTGNMWVGTQFGLNKLTSAGTWSLFTPDNTPAMPGKGIAALAMDAYADIWMTFIGTHGLVEFPRGNPANAQFIYQDSIPRFPSHGGSAAYATCIAADWAKNVWVGTAEDGVVMLDASGATVYNPSNTTAFKSTNVRTIAVDGCGHVWVGTDAGALMYDGSWHAHTLALGQLPQDQVNKISVDHSGHVWFGTDGGVAEFKPLPEKPLLDYPADNATVRTDSVTCTWAWDCPGILKYWYEIADNQNFTNSTIDTTSASLMQSMRRWDTLLVNHVTYYWRVKGNNDAGWGPFSDTWKFYVDKPVPVKPALALPASGAVVRKDTVTCSWGLTTASVFKYLFEYADNASFTNSTIDSTSASLMPGRSKLLSGLLDKKSYYWHIKAENDVGWGAFSDVSSFSVNLSSGVSMGMMDNGGCRLDQNYPNPFTGATTIHVSMNKHEHASLRLYDVLGRPCATLLDGDMGPGEFDVPLNAADLSECGMYVYRLQTGSDCQQRAMQVLR